MTLYYIQNTSAYAYDYLLWWRPDSKGYTHNLDEAGLYTEEQAKSIVAMRGEEIAWPAEEVQKVTERAVPAPKLRRLTKPAFEPTEAERAARRADVKPPATKCRDCGRFKSMHNCPPDDDQCDDCYQAWG